MGSGQTRSMLLSVFHANPKHLGTDTRPVCASALLDPRRFAERRGELARRQGELSVPQARLVAALSWAHDQHLDISIQLIRTVRHGLRYRATPIL